MDLQNEQEWKLIQLDDQNSGQQSFVLHIRVAALRNKTVYRDLEIALLKYIPKQNFSIIFRFNYENIVFTSEKKRENIFRRKSYPNCRKFYSFEKQKNNPKVWTRFIIPAFLKKAYQKLKIGFGAYNKIIYHFVGDVFPFS